MVTDLKNKIAMFESEIEGSVIIHDLTSMWCVIVKSNALDSINIMQKGASFYRFMCDDGKISQDEIRELNKDETIEDIDIFVSLVMYDIIGSWGG